MTRPSLSAAAAQVKESLRTSGHGAAKTRVRLAIQALPIAALASDDYARLVVVNAAALDLTGYSERELLRMAVPDLTAASDENNTAVLWEAFLSQGQQSGTYDIRARDGRTITVEYLAFANAAPGIHVSLLQPASPR
jgi:PAS domain S-box-containing protein